MKKFLKPQPLTRSEKRAAELDVWVKRHVVQGREADAAKKSRLRELRLAREALGKDPAANSEHLDRPPKPQLRGIKPRAQRIWISGPAARNEVATKKGDES